MNRQVLTRMFTIGAVVAGAFLAPASAFADGPQAQHLEVVSYSLGNGSVASGAGAGKATFKEFTVKKTTDTAAASGAGEIIFTKYTGVSSPPF